MSRIFDDICKIHDATQPRLHAHHIALYRMRSLIVKIGAHHRIQDSKGQERLLEQKVFAQRISSSLEEMDATVVAVLGSHDLVRKSILRLSDQALQVKASQCNGSTRKAVKAARKVNAKARASIIQAHSRRDWSDLTNFPGALHG